MAPRRGVSCALLPSEQPCASSRVREAQRGLGEASPSSRCPRSWRRMAGSFLVGFGVLPTTDLLHSSRTESFALGFQTLGSKQTFGGAEI